MNQYSAEIEPIQYIDADFTDYQTALELEKRLFFEKDDCCLVAACSVADIMLTIIWPGLGVFFGAAFLAALIFVYRWRRKKHRKTLSDPLKHFEWCVARAAETFNNLLPAWRHCLKGIDAGLIKEAEQALTKIRTALARTKETIERSRRFLEWFSEIRTISAALSEAELATFLSELLEAAKDLRAHISTLRENTSPLTEEFLKNEAALLSLEDALERGLPLGRIEG